MRRGQQTLVSSTRILIRRASALSNSSACPRRDALWWPQSRHITVSPASRATCKTAVCDAVPFRFLWHVLRYLADFVHGAFLPSSLHGFYDSFCDRRVVLVRSALGESLARSVQNHLDTRPCYLCQHFRRVVGDRAPSTTAETRRTVLPRKIPARLFALSLPSGRFRRLRVARLVAHFGHRRTIASALRGHIDHDVYAFETCVCLLVCGVFPCDPSTWSSRTSSSTMHWPNILVRRPSSGAKGPSTIPDHEKCSHQ